MLLFIFLTLSFIFTTPATSLPVGTVPPPSNILLNAPFTPFALDGSGNVNYTCIPGLAKDASLSGVNTVWIPGGLGQFDTLTIEERMQIASAWVSAGHQQTPPLFIIVHVGTSVQRDAIQLAQHALSIGADAIASVPPYYSKPATITALVSWLQPIAAAASPLPFYYYHIPASTGVTFTMVDLFPAAISAIPTWSGVKFVSSDLGDYATLVQMYKNNNALALLFAPEPKLAGIALGAKGFILAESFFAPTFLRMCHAVMNSTESNFGNAQIEQQWKTNIANIFSSFSGDAERTIYRQKIGMDLGPPRLPDLPLSESDYESLITQLNQYNFFNQVTPPPCYLP